MGRAAMIEAVHNRIVAGQQSWCMATDEVDLAITELGGMLGPVCFHLPGGRRVEPYAIAPWAEEPTIPDVPPVLRAMRGDWLCSAFGDNSTAHRGIKLPQHGETANGRWHLMEALSDESGSQLKLCTDLPTQGGRCESTTRLRHGHTVVYQRHDFSGLTGPFNPGHHATLRFDGRANAARLSFSRWKLALTKSDSVGGVDACCRATLLSGQTISDLSAVICADGSSCDLRFYPARPGFDDVVILCADADLPIAWSAVACPQQGYVWFSLRDPRLLNSTLLWFSNGGCGGAPWNGRHVNVLGIEDICALFDVGIAESCEANALTALGIPTCIAPDASGAVRIPYIQGVAGIDPEFDAVVGIDAIEDGTALRLRAASGVDAIIECDLRFLEN